MLKCRWLEIIVEPNRNIWWTFDNEIKFIITDFKNELFVSFSGSVPNLFEEGKGVDWQLIETLIEECIVTTQISFEVKEPSLQFCTFYPVPLVDESLDLDPTTTYYGYRGFSPDKRDWLYVYYFINSGELAYFSEVEGDNIIKHIRNLGQLRQAGVKAWPNVWEWYANEKAWLGRIKMALFWRSGSEIRWTGRRKPTNSFTNSAGLLLTLRR